LLTSVGAVAADEQSDRMQAALAAAERPAEDKARDAARKPIETIDFLGIESGMSVMDVFAAGGWFTEVLSAAVGPEGKVLSQNPTFFQQARGGAMAADLNARAARLGNVEVAFTDIGALGRDGQFDAAITAMNLHDVYGRGGEAAGMEFVQGVYKALKPGGVFGVIDHVGIAGQNNPELHRIEKDVARKLLTDAGFVIEAESDLLANPEDDHTLGIRDASLERRTDQFLFLARKPGG
jgi:predicted methyltransferase